MEREKGGSWAASVYPVAVAELWSLDGGAMAAMRLGVLAPFTASMRMKPGGGYYGGQWRAGTTTMMMMLARVCCCRP